jgi:hypothetical protein
MKAPSVVTERMVHLGNEEADGGLMALSDKDLASLFSSIH